MVQCLEQIILGLASTLQIQHLEAQCTVPHLENKNMYYCRKTFPQESFKFYF